MRNIFNSLLTISIVTTIIIGFSACGDGGNNAHFNNAQERILIRDCNSSTVIADYSVMISGDVLTQEEDNTVVTTYHDVNGTKSVCTVSGTAYLIRG